MKIKLSLFNSTLNILSAIKEKISILKKINCYTVSPIKIIFYSENNCYQKYCYILIKFLSKKYPNQIIYASSDKNDYIKNLDVKNLYLDNNFFLKYFFFKAKASYLFMTTTDLGNNILKKTKNIKHYVYYFHSPISTTISYTTSAFDNYDIILCNGNYQINEIRHREFYKKLKKKKLIKSGYLYFDYLKKKINNKNKGDSILVAPSWNYLEKNYINEDFEKIIDSLLSKNFKVIFRPHPEHLKRSSFFLEKIKNKFIGKNFLYDLDNENIGSMQKAKCLITDNSGIAIEFLLILNKPVLYYDSLKKIHNKEANEYKLLFNLENYVKDTFGLKFNYKQIDQIDSLILASVKNMKNKRKKIKTFSNKTFFNNNNITFFKNNINQLLY
jgi:YidC/Oxa1 family membrane protein insertase